MSKNTIRLIVPDSHGAHIDPAAEAALVADAKRLCPDEIVWLGDHLDCGGVFSAHGKSYTTELEETYADDCASTNRLLDAIGTASPKARQHYIEGNHEFRVERWATALAGNSRDASTLLSALGPVSVLELKRRGIAYYRSAIRYQSLSIPGTIRLGKCYFTHGISHAKHAAHVHVTRFGANVVFGHIHRAQSVVERTVTSDGFGAWCPGTLAKLQPLYRHTAPTSWSHGYAVQFVSSSGRFLHFNVPIHAGKSLLFDVVDAIGGKRVRK